MTRLKGLSSGVRPPAPQANWDLRTSGGNSILELKGDWKAGSDALPRFPPGRIATLDAAGSLAVACSAIGQWDSGLIEFLWDVKRAAAGAHVRVDWSGVPPAAQKLLGLLPERLEVPAPAQRARLAPLHWLGSQATGLLSEVGALVLVFSGTMRSGGAALRGRARLRGADIVGNISDSGPSALLIIGVVNFLIGAILAFVGAAQLRKFAAGIYVANLVGLALVREMAAVMTAIVMAGRTGGAYAARIATMQGNEEIDALQVFGIPVSDYVVLPAILALTITMPVLYFYGCLLGIFGGFVVARIMLGISGLAYLQQTINAVSLGQFIFGSLKSVAFALMIGVTSCRIGLRAGRSAADVGQAATEAVVTGIVGVIAMDAVFAVLADAVGFQ